MMTAMESDWRKSEKCGVFGTVGPRISFAETYLEATALKHRGNGPAGIATPTDGAITASSIDDLPLVGRSFKSTVMVGHTRYATSGDKETLAASNTENTQPFVLKENGFTLGLGHNGNIPDAVIAELRPQLHKKLSPSASDSAVLAQFLIEARAGQPGWTETFIQVLPLFKGAFSLVCFTDDGNLYAIRDPNGIRPLCIGQKDGKWYAVSESVALDAVGAEYVREVLPGEILCLKPDGSSQSITYAFSPTGEKRCLLEAIYFSRKASFDGQDSVEAEREALGRAAARRFKTKNIPIDWVVPILSSGKPMATGAAAELGIPIYEAIGLQGEERSFIQNTQAERAKAVHEKHIVFDPKHAEEIAGKAILLCDDSAVRGTSLESLIERIKALKAKGPGQIHILLGSEPVSDICEWGVDLPDKSVLLANRVGGADLAEIELRVAQFLGVDSVTYLTRSSVESALGRSAHEMCYHCFGGPSPTEHDSATALRAEQIEQLKAQKVLLLASGQGTNVAEVLHQMETGAVLAQPIGVITNKSDAGVISVAEKRNSPIPVTVLPSTGRRKTEAEKAQYEADLLAAIMTGAQGLPDVVVLAGWMLILSNEFVQKLTDLNIQIINLHPALLSGKGQNKVMTSRGLVPEIRGAHAIEETTEKSLEDMPVAGATVHRVLPTQQVDTGTVILKEEVRRRAQESVEDLALRIHLAEHRILSIALQRVLLERLAKQVQLKNPAPLSLESA